MKIRKVKIITITTIMATILVLIGIEVTTYKNKPNNKSAESTVFNEKTVSNDEDMREPLGNVDLSFTVLGDIHQSTDKFQEAINDFYEINPKIDALVLNGDTVDQGLEEQYNNVENSISKNKDFLPRKIIKNIGNHEFYDYNMSINSKEKVQELIKRYLEFSGEEKVYHDTWIKNYHFISLGSEDGNSETLDSVMAFISESQQAWLKEKLAKNYVKGKPIFVFLHQPLNYGNTHLLEDEQNKNIIEILSKYPEVILFTSHTHYDLTADSLVTKLPFTMIETGAVYYTIIPDESSANGVRIEPYIKGLYIEADGNKVIVKGRDIKEKQWIFIKEIMKK